MKESTLVTNQIRAFDEVMPGSVSFKHTDQTAGYPDVSLTWVKRTIWLEMKYNTVKGSDLQALNMKKLSKSGYAFYVRYWENPKRVEIDDPGAGLYTQITGFNYKAVAQAIREFLVQPSGRRIVTDSRQETHSS